MAEYPLVTRGLWIPDPNFIWPFADGPWSRTGFDASEVVQVASEMHSTPNAGVALRVGDLAGAAYATHYLRSGYSPLGVAGGPIESGNAPTLYFWVGVMARTKGFGGNETPVMKAVVRQWTAAGGDGTGTAAATLVDSDGNGLLTSTDFALYRAVTGPLTVADATRHYTLDLQFEEPDATTGDVLLLGVCVGVMFHATEATEQLASWYDAAPQVNSMIYPGAMPVDLPTQDPARPTGKA